MNGFPFLCLLATAPVLSFAQIAKKVVYGKYYSDWQNPGFKNYDDNSYFVFSPPRNLQQPLPAMVPVVFHLYGCGWKSCGLPFMTPTPRISQLVQNGIAFVSVGYRRITEHYWYDYQAPGSIFPPVMIKKPEELIDIDAEGRLTLNTQGKTFKDYQVRVARHEFLTKPTFDVMVAMESLIGNSYEYGIDMHRIYFWAFSAGGTMAQYLTFVYHKWNAPRYTPKGMFYAACMIDLPTANVLDRVWHIIGEATANGPNTKLKDLISKKDCWWTVGSGCGDSRMKQWFSPDMPYSTCNLTWNKITMDRYCGDGFENATVADLERTQVWLEDTEVAKGMTKIWYSSINMEQYVPGQFYTYLENFHKDDSGLLHSALFNIAYQREFQKVGIYYTMYFNPWQQQMDMSTLGLMQPVPTVFPNGYHLDYWSNTQWHTILASADMQPGTWDEPVRYACYVLRQPSCSPEFARQQLKAGYTSVMPATTTTLTTTSSSTLTTTVTSTTTTVSTTSSTSTSITSSTTTTKTTTLSTTTSTTISVPAKEVFSTTVPKSPTTAEELHWGVLPTNLPTTSVHMQHSATTSSTTAGTTTVLDPALNRKWWAMAQAEATIAQQAHDDAVARMRAQQANETTPVKQRRLIQV